MVKVSANWLDRKCDNFLTNEGTLLSAYTVKLFLFLSFIEGKDLCLKIPIKLSILLSILYQLIQSD